MVSRIDRPVFVDHDGTLTDSSREMGEYRAIVTEYNAEKLSLTNERADELMGAAITRILARPENYGWKWGKQGLIVASAISDHYLLNQAATELVITGLAEEKTPSAQVIVDQEGGMEEYLGGVFGSCAPRLGVYYRDEARDFLQNMESLGLEQWGIVTNSDAGKVVKKLSTLELGFEPKVVGGAKKYEVDRGWEGLLPVGPYKGFPGYPDRGVELQRKTFFETLVRTSGSERRVRQMVFVEDVAEFVGWVDYLAENDPDWENARTALVLTDNTPKWERDRYCDGNTTRFASQSLLGILGWIKGL